MKIAITLLCAAAITAAQTIPSGPLANMPASASDGSTYLATDQNNCSPLYIHINGQWQQSFSVGPSGALSCTSPGATVDITSQVPRLNAVNKWAGQQQFMGGVLGISSTTTSGNGQSIASPTLSVNGQQQASRSAINIVGQGITVLDDGTTLTVNVPAARPGPPGPQGPPGPSGANGVGSGSSLPNASQNNQGTITMGTTQVEVPLILTGGDKLGIDFYLRPNAAGAHAVHYFSNSTGVGLWDEFNGGGYVYNILGNRVSLYRALQLDHHEAGLCNADSRSTFVNEESVAGDRLKVCQLKPNGTYRWQYFN